MKANLTRFGLATAGLLGVLTLGACQSTPEETDPKASETVYRGILPCADCSGVRTSLTLYRDQDDAPSRFELRQQYLDGGSRDESSDVDRGNWIEEEKETRDGKLDVYVLNPDNPDEQMRFIKSASNAVELLSADGEPMDTDLNYTLMQQ